MATSTIGIIGFGFMGRTHAAGYLAAGGRARLVAVAGRRDDGLEARVAWLNSADELLERQDIDAVSICTYTDSHVPLALEALERGKHVLVEKPVALQSGEVVRLVRAARATALVCMPAMCMRFWPGWPWLRECVRAQTYGAVRRAVFTRLGSRPSWGAEFYLDERRSGGALFDLHIHDADFIRWCFGNPVEVESRGTMHDVTTQYRFAGNSMDIRARGAWLPDPSAPFAMRYEVEFETALVRFELGAVPALRVERGGSAEAISLPETSAYDAEIVHFLDLIEGRARLPVAPLDDAVAVTRLLEAEAESLRLAHSVAPGSPGR